MNLADRLSRRLNMPEIKRICDECRNDSRDDTMKAGLFALIDSADDRVGFNALWVLTHFSVKESEWLQARRNQLIDMLLSMSHVGKRRLILTLLDRMPCGIDDIRTDYLDFCLRRINSAEPYGIRALCLRQAFAQCRYYPELMEELKIEIADMSRGELSPGLRITLRAVGRHMAAEGL